MGSRLVDQGVGAILSEAVSTDPETVLVVNPGRHTTERIVSQLSADASGPEVQILATDAVLKDVLEDFLVASAAADLVETGRLQLRSGPGATENALIVTDDEIIALIRVNGDVAGLSTDDASFVDRVDSTYRDHWDGASTYTLRTPGLGRVRETLASDIGNPAETDFTAMLDAIDTATGNGDDLDEVTISLLVAARNDTLLYDISKWGEDVGIASKATFSRTKTDLEDQGVIDTEKVPIDVGRPRLRLKLADERLVDASRDELAGKALQVLS